MKHKRLEIHRNKEGYRVIVCKLRNKSNREIALGVFVLDENDNPSSIKRVKRSNKDNIKQFDFLLDLECNFELEDINIVRDTIWDCYDELEIMNDVPAMFIKEIHAHLVEYAKQNNGFNRVIVENGLCDIPKEIFNEVIKDLELDINPLHIKRELLYLGMTIGNGDRNDYGKADSEGYYRVIRIKEKWGIDIEKYKGEYNNED